MEKCSHSFKSAGLHLGLHSVKGKRSPTMSAKFSQHIYICFRVDLPRVPKSMSSSVNLVTANATKTLKPQLPRPKIGLETAWHQLVGRENYVFPHQLVSGCWKLPAVLKPSCECLGC